MMEGEKQNTENKQEKVKNKIQTEIVATMSFQRFLPIADILLLLLQG